MENKEMKQKNEEILNKWRTIGFLQGLKEGSINEWRCAKSFDDMVLFLLKQRDENCDKYACLDVFAFAFIRRVLCTGKKRLYRLIAPLEIINFFETTTLDDCLLFLKEKNEKTPKESKSLKGVYRKLFYNILSLDEINQETILSFIDNFQKGKTRLHENLNKVLVNVFDLEAELMCVITDLFVEKNYKNSTKKSDS